MDTIGFFLFFSVLFFGDEISELIKAYTLYIKQKTLNERGHKNEK